MKNIACVIHPLVLCISLAATQADGVSNEICNAGDLAVCTLSSGG